MLNFHNEIGSLLVIYTYNFFSQVAKIEITGCNKIKGVTVILEFILLEITF